MKQTLSTRPLLARMLFSRKDDEENYIQRSNDLVLPFPSRVLLLHLEDLDHLWSLIYYMH